MGTHSAAWHAEVLEIMRRRTSPVSAYEVLDELRETNKKIAPPTVYRVLDALTSKGQIHRLESLKRYIVCQCDEHEHASVLSICDDCGSVEENFAPDLLSTLSNIIGKAGFSAQRHVIEVHGVCGACGSGHATT